MNFAIFCRITTWTYRLFWMPVNTKGTCLVCAARIEIYIINKQPWAKGQNSSFLQNWRAEKTHSLEVRKSSVESYGWNFMLCLIDINEILIAIYMLLGRSWKASELRLKSWDDLNKLWYVLLKEKNMLMTQRQMLNAQNLRFPNPERIPKVKVSNYF